MPDRVSLRELALAVGALGAIGLALLWPMLLSPASSTVDAWFAPSQLLTIDLFTRGLLEEGRLVGESLVIGWPQGGWLSIVGWSYLPLTIPAALLGASTVAAVNLGVVLQLLGAGVACFLLARRLGVGPAAATAVSAYYAYHPFALHQLYNGQFTELCHWGPPLMVLAVLRLRDRVEWSTLAVLALVTGLSVSSSPYNATTGLILMGAVGAWQLWRAPGERGRVALGLGLAALAVLLGSLPFVYYYAVMPHGQNLVLFPNQLMPQNALRNDGGAYATVAGWLLPERGLALVHALWGGESVLPPALTRREHALGLLALALAGWGLLRERAPRRDGLPGAAFWLIPMLVCASVASGYYLMLGPRLAVTVGGWPVPMPQRVLFELAPAVRSFSSSYRVALGVLLCVALLAGLGLQHGLDRAGARRRWLVVLVGGALVVEGLLTTGLRYPLPIQDLRPLQVHRDLADLEGGGVLEIPWWPTESMPNSQLLAFRHLTHHHPVHHSEQGPPRDQTPHELVRTIAQQRGESLPERGLPVSSELPATWFVLHEHAVSPSEAAMLHGELESVATVERRYPEDGVSLYRAREP